MPIKAYSKKAEVVFVLIAVFLLIVSCSSPTKKATPTPTYSPRPTSTPSSALSPVPSYPVPGTSPTVKPTPKPIIMLPTGNIPIGTVLQKSPVQVFIEIGNAGDADLNIYRIDVPDFFLCKSSLPLIIYPSNTIKLEFLVDTQQARSLDSTISFQTNDTYTPRQAINVQGHIDPVSIEVRERHEQYLQLNVQTQPQYLSIVDLGRETSWLFQPVPVYSKKWLIKVLNSGPGNADGTLTVLATRDGNVSKDSKTFHLISNQETILEFTLALNFLFSLLGKYEYKYEIFDIKEEVLKERTFLDIYRVTKDGEENLDTFLKDSEKAKTWKESDYIKTNPVVLSLTLQGGPKTPTSQPIQPTPSSPPMTISIPTVTETPPDLDLQVSNIQENHSVDINIFSGVTIYITIQAHARLTNTGDKESHNVKAYIRASAKSNGQTIKLNGQDTLTFNLGDLPGKQSLEKDLSLNMQVGRGTAEDLQNNGIIFTIDVVSDETQKKSFPQSYTP